LVQGVPSEVAIPLARGVRLYNYAVWHRDRDPQFLFHPSEKECPVYLKVRVAQSGVPVGVVALVVFIFFLIIFLLTSDCQHVSWKMFSACWFATLRLFNNF
jgi:hypothetical protein